MKERQLLRGNILVVTTGRSLERLGYVGQLVEWLSGAASGDKVIVYDKISAEPDLDEVKEAIEIGKARQVKTVVGFGGGSALDAAKAVAAGIPVEEDIEGYLLDSRAPSPMALPIIAIPTTAGTGSELSKAAILSCRRHGIKAGIRGESVIPILAVVDAAYTWSVPQIITMETGFDALAHAVESYMAVKANPFSEMLSLEAIRLVEENLLRLEENLEDHEAREKMCFASMVMGFNLANVGTCLPHRMQYAIGAATGTNHAAGLVALYPSWIFHEFAINPQKIQQVFKSLGYAGVQNARDARGAMDDFLGRLCIRRNLHDLGVKRSGLQELSGKVTGNLANDPLWVKGDIIDIILEEAYGGE